MKEEYLKTYAWMNTLRGGVLRDVYALIYQLAHDGRRKGTVKISIGYISERLGYSSRNIQRALVELKETGCIEVEYADGSRSIYKALTHDKLSPPTHDKMTPLETEQDPRQIVTPEKLTPLTDCRPTNDKLSPPISLYKSLSKDKSLHKSIKDNRVDNIPPPPSARERLQKWFEESSIKEWANMMLTRNHFDKDIGTLLDEFFDNDFTVRERCEQNERTEVLKHFQNWLPKYINKLKNEQNNATNHNPSPPKPPNPRSGGIISPEDFARSFSLGWNSGKREQ